MIKLYNGLTKRETNELTYLKERLIEEKDEEKKDGMKGRIQELEERRVKRNQKK